MGGSQDCRVSIILPKRRLIPRWRRTAVTLEMSEASFSSGKTLRKFPGDADGFDEARARWREMPTVGHLGDVLAYSIFPELLADVRSVASEVVSKSAQTTIVQNSIVNRLLGRGVGYRIESQTFAICNPAIRREVHQLRQVLAVNPSNPLALLDMAQFQLAAGRHRDAERSLLSARALSPNNRLVIRTLSRFYVHVRQPDAAHRLVKAHPRTPHDPWLMASEVALAEIADAGSKFANRGFKFVRDKEAANPDLSELAGALGGVELKNGAVRRARELFRVALMSPNDNVIAQAITNQDNLSIDLRRPMQSMAQHTAAEAQTLLSWEALDTEVAEPNAIAWHAEEPFSSRPLQFLTTLYAVQSQFDRGINLAKRGLIADPDDSTLQANLAYLLASSGELSKSEAVLRRLSKTGNERFDAIILATTGLIAMKRGKYELGSELYRDAIERFNRRSDIRLMTTCFAYYAKSAFDTLHPKRAEILVGASDQYAKAPCADAAIILRALDMKIEPSDQSQSARRLSQWVFDEKKNVLAERLRVTRPGDAPLVVIKGPAPKGGGGN